MLLLERVDRDRMLRRERSKMVDFGILELDENVDITEAIGQFVFVGLCGGTLLVEAVNLDAGSLEVGFDLLELGLKHKTANFGMSLLQRLKPKWFSGVDPFDSLAWTDTIAAFEKKLAEGGYLESLMDKY